MAATKTVKKPRTAKSSAKAQTSKASTKTNTRKSTSAKSTVKPSATKRAKKSPVVPMVGYLPGILSQFGVKKLLDVQCGTFDWLEEAKLGTTHYVGMDRRPDLVGQNAERYAKKTVSFEVGDMCHDPLPKADLVMCRGAFAHMTFAEILAFLRNVEASESDYLMVTQDDTRQNLDVPEPSDHPAEGLRRNLKRWPFNMGEGIAKFPDWDGLDADHTRFMVIYGRWHIGRAIERMAGNGVED